MSSTSDDEGIVTADQPKWVKRGGCHDCDPREVKKISPAMVVALIALFVSLSGNAMAVGLLVTSGQIKDKTIQVAAHRPGCSRVASRTRGPPGATRRPRRSGPPRGPWALLARLGPAGTSFSKSMEKQRICTEIRTLQDEVEKLRVAHGARYMYWVNPC